MVLHQNICNTNNNYHFYIINELQPVFSRDKNIPIDRNTRYNLVRTAGNYI